MNRIAMGALACACLVALAPANSRKKRSPDSFTPRVQALPPPHAATRRDNPLDKSSHGAPEQGRAKAEAGAKAEAAAIRARKALSLPVIFEPSGGQFGPAVQFVGHGKGLSMLLGEREISVLLPEKRSRGKFRRVNIRMAEADAGMTAAKRDARKLSGAASRADRHNAEFSWMGEGKLPGESNYFLGSDARAWRTHVPHYGRILARDALPGVNAVVYGNARGVEYDLEVAPETDSRRIRLEIAGADAMRVNEAGDLLLDVAGKTLRMGRPEAYETFPVGAGFSSQAPMRRKNVRCGYVIERDGTVGFRVARHDAGAELVLDPSISLAYDSLDRKSTRLNSSH